ncbi:MAG TPA: 5'-3' exonuclease H3TH domain-containing protein, partial [Rhizomicrobium sp.]|nr:5'-3' exonuclease H3TH domain-containing protein [Rhizomicrobium sp.]
MSALKKGDHLYLVDGSGYLFRAYHALPPLSRKSDGLPTGAVAGYCNMLWKLLEDMKGGDVPTHLAVIFDAGEVTFRNKIYKDYKAHRPPPPEDLIPQFPLVRDATRAFGVACVEMAGYEADDLIATYARAAHKAGARTTIISSDKDLMQLVVDGAIELYDTMKNKRITSAEVLEKFGVAPDKVVQVQALAGDSTDNVPGVRGIGIKTAAELIGAYGDVETLLKRAGEIKQNKRRETLIENADNARISLRLVTLDCEVPLKEQPHEFAVRELDPQTLIAFLKAMEFSTITKRVAAHFKIENYESVAPAASVAAPPAAPLLETPAAASAEETALRAPIDHSAYVTVISAAELDKWIARAREKGVISVDTETTSLDPMQAG